MEGYLGQIILFASNFAPTGWAFCEGQLLPISQNTALFSLLGTMYGGNGTTTFALPDLRGRVPVGTGQGPGLSSHTLGQMAGSEAHTLTSAEMPAHTHNLQLDLFASADPAVSTSPAGNLAASSRSEAFGPAQNVVALDDAAAQVQQAPAGSGQPHNNMQPYIAMNYIICVQGMYPSRT